MTCGGGEMKKFDLGCVLRLTSFSVCDEQQARAALAFSMDADAGGVAGGGADMLLPLFVGDVVTLLQECEDGWFLGHSANNPGHKGVFPRDET